MPPILAFPVGKVGATAVWERSDGAPATTYVGLTSTMAVRWCTVPHPLRAKRRAEAPSPRGRRVRALHDLVN